MDKSQVFLNEVLDYAISNESIRLVEMNGSRVNQLVKKDEFQDFDIVFYVKDYLEFIRNFNDMSSFGKILVMQTKADQILSDQDEEAHWYIYMAQYQNGMRLDLTIKEVQCLPEELMKDSLSQVILDKDGYDVFVLPNESTYYVSQPSKEAFLKSVNEFYWVCPYIGKGLARNQIFYANKHITIIRNQLEQLLDWWIGYKHQYKVSVGKGKSRYHILLPNEWYALYKKTYVSISIKEMETALLSAILLFDQVALEIEKRYHFGYDIELKKVMISFLNDKFLKKVKAN